MDISTFLFKVVFVRPMKRGLVSVEIEDTGPVETRAGGYIHVFYAMLTYFRLSLRILKFLFVMAAEAVDAAQLQGGMQLMKEQLKLFQDQLAAQKELQREAAIKAEVSRHKQPQFKVKRGVRLMRGQLHSITFIL